MIDDSVDSISSATGGSGTIPLIPSPMLSKFEFTDDNIWMISFWRAIAAGSSNGGAALTFSISAVNWVVSAVINPGIESTLAFVSSTNSCNAAMLEDIMF